MYLTRSERTRHGAQNLVALEKDALPITDQLVSRLFITAIDFQSLQHTRTRVDDSSSSLRRRSRDDLPSGAATRERSFWKLLCELLGLAVLLAPTFEVSGEGVFGRGSGTYTLPPGIIRIKIRNRYLYVVQAAAAGFAGKGDS